MFHTIIIGEIKAGKARFHALIQVKLHNFDKKIPSFKNLF